MILTATTVIIIHTLNIRGHYSSVIGQIPSIDEYTTAGVQVENLLYVYINLQIMCPFSL